MRAAALLVAALVLACSADPEPGAPAPPPYPYADAPPALPPRWVFEPWVWEDDANTQAATLALVEGHLSRGLPVGAVIVDSPWQEPGERGYHTFRFDPERYPDPKAMIDSLHARGVRVVVWATGNMDPEAPGYDDACDAGFFVRAPGGADPCPTTSFWKGSGRASHVDFFHPGALAWWREMLDRALELGVDGFKVDGSDLQLAELGDRVETHAGPKTLAEYSAAFYATFLDHARARLGAERAAILARPFAVENGVARWYAPRETCTACWVGDQERSFEGLREALEEVLASARAGYAVVGSDVGGFRPDPDAAPDAPPDVALFLRWTQLGALLPLMETGGRGEHRPWTFGEPALTVYRRFAALHHELAPFFLHLTLEAHAGGAPPVRPGPGDAAAQYTLGEDLLVAPALRGARSVELPAGRWRDWWAPEVELEGPARFEVEVPLERAPLFVRSGAVIPMAGAAGETVLLVFPDKEPGERRLHLAPGVTLPVSVTPLPGGANVALGPSRGAFRVRVHAGGEHFVERSVVTDGEPVALEVASGTLGDLPPPSGDTP